MGIDNGFDLLEELLLLCPDLKEKTVLSMRTCSEHYRDQKKPQDVGIDCYFVQPLEQAHVQRLIKVVGKKGLFVGL